MGEDETPCSAGGGLSRVGIESTPSSGLREPAVSMQDVEAKIFDG